MDRLSQSSGERKADLMSGLRILVVDDNVDAAQSLALMLQLSGYDAISETDGVSGLERAGEFQPEVMLLDIGMPRLDGYEIARRVRSEPWGRDLSLIAMTGWSRAEDVERAVDAGFNHHLVKPVELDVLLDLLNSKARVTSPA